MIVFKIRGLILSLAFLWSVAFFGSAVAQTNELTGRISMPAGVVPVSSPAVFRISSVPLDSVEENGQSIQTFTDVSIAVLGSFADYSIALLDAEPEAPQPQVLKKIKFECMSGCANIRITTSGYWGGSAGVVAESEAIEFDALSPQVFNIQLERADHFSGTFELPEGLLASGSEVFTLTAKGSQFSNPATFSQVVEADSEDTKWSFFIGVPSSSTGGGWTLSLSCESCAESIPVGPYFPTTSGGNPVTTDSQAQFFFLKNRSYSNIQFTLPAPPPPPEEPKVFNIAPLNLLLLDE